MKRDRVNPGSVRARSYGAVYRRPPPTPLERLDRIARSIGWVIAWLSLGYFSGHLVVYLMNGGQL